MPIRVHYGKTSAATPAEAVADLARQLDAAALEAAIIFCASQYDLAALGQALKQCFPCPVIACTSSGQIGPDGFERAGLVGIGLGGGFRVQLFPISPLADHAAQAVAIARRAKASVAGRSRFGLLLIDGLSMLEERVTASLYQALDNVPIIGGSAGDDLKFERTAVYDGDGCFLSGAAVFALIDTDAAILPFKVQHFRPSDTEFVITAADPEQRIIHEMNGEPAALAYAQALGQPVAALGPELFSKHPLVLTYGAETYVRSILRSNPDQSLTCYCAIEEGLIVTLGVADSPLETLQLALGKVHQALGGRTLILACDCILRRLEFEHTGDFRAIGRLMAENRVFGFSTYGEQFNGIHVNQTFTGIALGA
ncbi:FIST N-terminal domain-containing protein, partial [Azoarcus sp. TTM-91]|uniref:FIST N-terminal domain-containing protein n=1 Tax=Azoarcus sp. TTM-91 TaxID=2691581 RepID=UPI001B7CE9BC